MKYLIALLGFATLCCAQTRPSIVGKLTLNDQTTLLGSSRSPIPLYTPAQDASQPISYYTTPTAGTSVGSYNMNIVIEHLD